MQNAKLNNHENASVSENLPYKRFFVKMWISCAICIENFRINIYEPSG